MRSGGEKGAVAVYGRGRIHREGTLHVHAGIAVERRRIVINIGNGAVGSAVKIFDYKRLEQTA